MSAHGEIKPGIYLERIVGKVGTGHTAKDSVTENFWRAAAGDSGKVHVELLDINDQPTGYAEDVDMKEFAKRFTYQDDYKPQKDQEKEKAADKVTARAERHLEAEEFLSAEFEFSNAIKIDKDNVRANFGLGNTYLATGETEKAKEQFKKLAKLDEIADPRYKHIFNEFGIKLRRLGMYAEAAKHYNKALAITKDDENLWFNLGRALFEGGNAKVAATALRKALELNPDFVEARALLHNLENGGS